METKDDNEKGTAFFWKSTSIEPQISSLSLRHGISKVALGNEHTLILTYDSQVFATGENHSGQLGLGDLTRRVQTTRLVFFERRGAVDIACGAEHSAAVCDNGDLYCWGDSTSGQCGIGEIKSSPVPVLVTFNDDFQPIPRPRSKHVDCKDEEISSCLSSERSDHEHNACKVVQVSCGDTHTLALSSDGQVWAWGSGCQTGHGTQNECYRTPRLVEGLRGKTIVSVKCGAYHSIALAKDPSIQPRLVPHRSNIAQKGSVEKKRSKKMRKLSRSWESTKGKKAQSLLDNNEVPPLNPNTDVKRIHLNISPKTYISYESEASSQTDISEGENVPLSGTSHEIDKNEKETDSSLNKVNTQHMPNDPSPQMLQSREDRLQSQDQQIGRPIDSSQTSDQENVTIEENSEAPLQQSAISTDLSDNKANMSMPAHYQSSDVSSTSFLTDEHTCKEEINTPSLQHRKDSVTIEENQNDNDDVTADSSCKHRATSASIPINRLSVHDDHYGIPLQTRKTYLESIVSSSPEFSPPPGNFFKTLHFDHSNNDLFITTDVSGCLCETSSLFENIEPTSLSSLGSISDSDEVTSPVPADEKSTAMSAYLGFGILTSRLRQEMDIGKITSAVYDSVTGMFMPSTTSTLPSQVHKSAVKEAHCTDCGVLGICICNKKASSSSQERFVHEGYDTQVWTWGRGGCGQLGHADTEDRSLPCCIENLSGTGIIKICAGTFHSLALTVYCQVFSWGDNSCGQLGHKRPIAVKPRKVKCFSDVLIWDVACGSHYSMFVGDMALNKTDVYVCGRQPSDMPVIAAALNKLHESSSESSVTKDDSAIKAAMKVKRPLAHSRSFDDAKERSLGGRIELVRLIMFRKVGSVRSVLAQNEHCCCLAASDTTGVMGAMSELSSQERFFYYQLALIWQAVFVPVMQSDLWPLILHQDNGSVLAPVIQGYLTLMKCVSSSVVSVTQTIQYPKPWDELFDTCLSDDFIMAFERYSELVSNAVAFGVFMLFTSLGTDVGPQCKAVLQDLLEDADKDFIGYTEAFQCVARVPMIRTQHYVDVTKKLLMLVPKDDPKYVQLQRVSELWETLSCQDEKRYLLAEQTRQFWEDCPSKITETFKVPNRRLLRSSRTHPLFPSKSARFSSPMYVLFDDYFVHIQSNKNFQALPLNTLWAENVEDSENLMHAIKITSPEETLLVCTHCFADKADWLLTINKAIARIISKTSAYRLGKDAVNPQTGSLSAATAREAAYTFTQDTRYKGATYSGMWFTGKPHGRGELTWSDGRQYSGEFQNGLHDGEGFMVFPSNVPDNPAERYEGQWLQGKMAGHGKMRYTNGDTYVGHWMDNMRHGHGTMKCGALSSSAASVYIGEWMTNKRHGYGSLDDVIRGEKYMGMWENDCRHGNGVIVTLEGHYIQGTFVQNKLMGIAQLVCDDNTYYDGEFSSQFQLAGKGTLTLPSGDIIDGTFNGQWGDGIKISGTFWKKESDSNSKSKSVVPDVKPVMSPDRKWGALFRQCREALGCQGDHDADVQNVWKCISMALLSGHNGKLPRTEQDVMQELLNVNNEMERTGNHSLEDIKAVQSYLAKAFEMSYHPLGELVSGLVDVYRATYVGMGTHRRLLPHAVAEAKSIIHRLYNIVRLVFTDLPNEEYVHLDKDTLTGISNHHTEISTSSSALLHAIVLPLLYPPLFTLYALHNERADSIYWERLLHLNWRSDLVLMKYVGVKRQFWLSDEGEEKVYSEEFQSEYREAHHYVSAIEALQQISTKLSPMEKLAVLKTTFEKINEEVHAYWKGEEKLISLDDLFPVFQFVTIRARIPHMGSEIHFIDDMVDSHVHVGEQGHMFTTLKASFFQIQNEKG